MQVSCAGTALHGLATELRVLPPRLQVLREQVMLGYFGLTASFGEGSAAYQGYLARTRAQAATTGNGTDCDLQLDDEGLHYIWAQDHDGSASTPLECGGNDNQAEDSYAPYAYDATYAVAYALHYLIVTLGKTSVVVRRPARTCSHHVSVRGPLRRLRSRARFCARRARSQPANGPGKVQERSRKGPSCLLSP